MTYLTVASNRTKIGTIEGKDLERRKFMSDPNALSGSEINGLPASGPLVLSGARQRPRYFDGRFLTGADLTRDQEYVRQRQADLARASGSGVVSGLQVKVIDSDRLQIESGHGITPAGDLVVISRQQSISVNDLPAIQRLDAHLGLTLQPSQPLTLRSGLFILALRPVEFTSNLIAAYPTTLTGPRSVEFGDIIEATAITLIPYPENGGASSLDDMRRAVSRLIFVEGSTNGQPQEALPLAMLALDGGAIRWLDVDMVRRETGADTPLQVSIGAKPRALAEAHVLQYAQHLADVLQTRNGKPFPAAEVFGALPAAGRLPLASITYDNIGFLQAFFPSIVDVEVSFVASDEIAALVEESLALPPIDLMGDTADLDATGVVILVPVKRKVLANLLAGFGEKKKTARTLGIGLGIRRMPLAILNMMNLRRDLAVAAPEVAIDALTAEDWKTAWEYAKSHMEDQRDGQPQLLWYVRRRTVAYRSQLEGKFINLTAIRQDFSEWREARLKELNLGEIYVSVLKRTKEVDHSYLAGIFGSPRYLASRMIFAEALLRVNAISPPDGPIAIAAIDTALGDFNLPDLGSGFTRLNGLPGQKEFELKISNFLFDEKLFVAVDKKLRSWNAEKFPENALRLSKAVTNQKVDDVKNILATD